MDQGIGRARWFIGGGRTPDVAAAVRRFASHRHADLWSGVGLAAASRGGDGLALEELSREAGPHTAALAQGAVFAIKARAHAGYVPPETRTAATALTGLPVEAAVALADGAAPDPPPPGPPRPPTNSGGAASRPISRRPRAVPHAEPSSTNPHPEPGIRAANARHSGMPANCDGCAILE